MLVFKRKKRIEVRVVGTILEPFSERSCIVTNGDVHCRSCLTKDSVLARGVQRWEIVKRVPDPKIYGAGAKVTLHKRFAGVEVAEYYCSRCHASSQRYEDIAKEQLWPEPPIN